MLHADTGDVGLAYDQAGVGSPSMLFLHGWMCDHSYFAPQFSHYSPRTKVVSLDLRGHGESDTPDPIDVAYSVETLADDAAAVATAAGLERIVVVGHSLGALVALAHAAADQRVEAVIMIDPSPFTDDAVKQYFVEAAPDCASDADGAWRRAFLGGAFLPTDSVRRAEIMRDLPAKRADVAAALLLSLGQFHGAAALAGLQVPVLSLGSASPANPPEDLKRLYSAITVGQTVGAGHFNHLEVPDQVNAMIDRFLANNGLLAAMEDLRP